MSPPHPPHPLDPLRDSPDLAALSARFRGALVRYFLRQGLGGADAEDCVQDVFLRLSRRATLADIGNLEGYLFETAASVAIDHQRRGRARAAGAHDAYEEDRHAPLALGPDRGLEARDELRRVTAALRELPERTRHVFVLVRLERMRHAEVARRLGVSVSAVEKHLLRASVHLARRVGGER